jgi:outer membrane receptor for ferrienterochelin and colicin
LSKKTAQGFIMNADATLSQQGGTATDVLRNMPTVAVDADGGVTIRGKAPMILINGRNSALTNLESIPAASIESIEVINSPGAQYDADSEGAIINIKLKKSDLDNLNVALALANVFLSGSESLTLLMQSR